MRRLDDVFACGATALYLAAALPGHGWAGDLGQWASDSLHVAFGHASWIAPAWLVDGAVRAWVGAPRDVRRACTWAFHAAAACTTLSLFTWHGGWLGKQCALALWTTIGIGAFFIAIGVWLVVMAVVLGQAIKRERAAVSAVPA